MEIIIAIGPSVVAAIASIACVLISSKAKEEQEKSAREAQEYRNSREKLDKAKWRVLIATMEGVTVLLKQAKGEKLNGNVQEALDNINNAEDMLNDVQSEIFATI